MPDQPDDNKKPKRQRKKPPPSPETLKAIPRKLLQLAKLLMAAAEDGEISSTHLMEGTQLLLDVASQVNWLLDAWGSVSAIALEMYQRRHNAKRKPDAEVQAEIKEFLARKADGATIPQLARDFDIEEGTIKKRLYRHRKKKGDICYLSSPQPQNQHEQ
jgi:hypothetical protein